MTSSPLFQPFACKSLHLPNRIVMAPMTRGKSPGGIPGPANAAYYRRRAKGGVGLIVTEGTTIDRPSASNNPGIPNFHDPLALAGWRLVVEAVHEAGGKIAPQLWHQGLMRKPGTGPNPDAPSEGPSEVPGNNQAMSDADIADTIAAFGKAAAAAKDIGFDAVELHGAHGYLIDQFAWDGANKRDDLYGGEAVQRMRFATEIVKAVRREVGPDYVIIHRFSQWKIQDYDAKLAPTPQALEAILAPLAEAGIDMFHASNRRFWEPEFEDSDLNLAGWTKKLTGRPVITVGSIGLQGGDFMTQLRGDTQRVEIGDLALLEERLARGDFDLVAVGRALVADPNWARKVREGRNAELLAFDRAALATLD